MDMAKAEGQAIGPAARDGTPAAGVHKVTELMPTLMNDIVATAPEDHKVRRKYKSDEAPWLDTTGMPADLLERPRRWRPSGIPACPEHAPLPASSHPFDTRHV